MLSVVVFHAFPGSLNGGFIGVDIFFVISGFLITSHIFERLASGDFSFSEFFGQRIRRIFPALVLVMASSLVVGWYSLLADEYAQLGKHITSGAGFVLNFILAEESGYFDNAAETKPMLHLWSLAVEEQFYIIWPLVLWIAWKRNYNLLLITLVIASLSFYLNLKFVGLKPVKTFFWPVGRFWELLSGGILAWLALYRGAPLAKIKSHIDARLERLIRIENPGAYGSLLAHAMSLLGLSIITYGVIGLSESSAFPWFWALIPVSGSLLVIAAGRDAKFNRVFLMNRIAIWFGLISYPLYLWHWPMLSFLQIINGELPGWGTRASALLISVLLAWLTYEFIEKPIRFGRFRSIKAISSAIVLVIVGSLGWYVHVNEGRTSYNKQLKYIADARNDWAYPTGLISSEKAGFTYWSTSKRASRIVFLGDSHIEMYGPRVVDLYMQNLIEEVTFVTGGGCPIIPQVYENAHPDCRRLTKHFDRLVSTATVDTVVIGTCFNCYLLEEPDNSYYFEDHKGKFPLSGREGLERAKASLYHYVKGLAEKHEVIVLLDNPSDKRFDPGLIIESERSGRRNIPLDTTISVNPFYQDESQVRLATEMRTGLENAGATVVSQSPVLCPDGLCDALTENGLPKYKDSNHIRPFFVIERMNVLDEFLLKTRRR